MPFVLANGKRLHYRDSPPDDGSAPRETFVLLHGLGSSQNYYGGVVPILTAQNHRCISVDTTGSGRSPYTFVEQTIHSLAADVIGLMDELNIAKAAVAGHSMQGIIVPYLAATWPDRVTAIVLLGPVKPNAEAAPTFEKRIEAVEKGGMEAMADTVPYGALGPNARPIERAFARELLLAQDPDGYKSLCRVIATSHLNPPDYSKVKCRTLLIAGEEDKSAPLAGCEAIINAIGAKDKQMEVQKGIGHWMCIEVPEDTGERIAKFFS